MRKSHDNCVYMFSEEDSRRDQVSFIERRPGRRCAILDALKTVTIGLALLCSLIALVYALRTYGARQEIPHERSSIVGKQSEARNNTTIKLVDERQVMQKGHAKLAATYQRIWQKVNRSRELLTELAQKVEMMNNTAFNQNQELSGCMGVYITNPITNTCLRMVTEEKTWQDAKDFCEENGEYLVTFERLESAAWFINLRRTNPAWGNIRLWIGGRQNVTGSWEWQGRYSGPITDTLWSPGEPNDGDVNEDCMDSKGTIKTHYLFNDHPCFFRQAFVCETN